MKPQRLRGWFTRCGLAMVRLIGLLLLFCVALATAATPVAAGENTEVLLEDLSRRLAAPGVDARERFELLFERGTVRRRLGRYELATEDARALEAVATSLDEPGFLARQRFLAGSIDAEQGRMAAAIGHFLQGNDALDGHDNIEVRALLVSALGVAYQWTGDPLKARRYYEETLALARQFGDHSLEVTALGNLGSAVGDLGNLSRAVDFHRQGLAIAELQGLEQEATERIANLCDLQVKLDNRRAAEESCQRALEALDDSFPMRMRAGVHMAYGDLKRELEEPAAALAQYELALALARGRAPLVMSELLQRLGDLAFAQGRPEAAATYYREQLDEWRKGLDRRREAVAAELKARHDVERAEKEIELLQLNNRLQQSGLTARNRLLLALAAGLLLAVLLVALAFYSYRRQLRLKGILREQNDELERALVRIRELASRDALTGLLNRRGFEDVAGAAHARCRREKTSCGVLVADIDRFKATNDRLGHAVGDEVLRAVADRIAGVVRNMDVACRWGGEEFVIVYPGLSYAELERAAARVREAIVAAPVDTSVGPLPVTLTIGLASVGEDLDRAIRQADEAMYRGKRAGRDRIMAATAPA
ncbi:tetratricopeptide repeat-containing diguanylate cyclase [Pseudohaliea rubra]|uniref:diguanylate cyclase n=1 Tax=Pseudohaliea rubra DSM 19751 TaxID=1265313 RepID=A0A095X1V6_9GAMM|nr:diguanylate cyclase [Pseudohaliea rubra]KGE04869.1 sensory box/GGDEF domain protein [Pseudohaliea rubra DSM 19751]